MCYLLSSYMFRAVQVHHAGGVHKGVEVQQILSNMRVYGVKMKYC
jgi:hypothetical protein